MRGLQNGQVLYRGGRYMGINLKKNNTNERNHKGLWTKEELEVVYRYYNKLTFKEIASMLPNRSFCAVKNKVKKIKFHN